MKRSLLGEFMICRVLVVFDALKNNARLIYLADVKDKDPATVYGRERMAAVQQKLAGPVCAHPAETMLPRREPVDFLKKFGQAPAEFLAAIRQAKKSIYLLGISSRLCRHDSFGRKSRSHVFTFIAESCGR